MRAAAALAALLGAALPEATSSAAPPTATAWGSPSRPITHDSDLDPAGECKAVVDKACPEVQRGAGRVLQCVEKAQKTAKISKKESLPEDLMPCFEKVREFKMAAVRAVPVDQTNLWPVEPVKDIREACRQDAAKECPGMVGPALSTCLRKRRGAPGKLSPACDAKVFAMQESLSKDISLAPGLYDACQADLKRFPECTPRPGTGIPASCLPVAKQHRMDLSEQCRAKLFGWEMESAQNLKLNEAVQDACEDEIESFCGNKAFGEARVLQCLWEGLNAPATNHLAKFSSECSKMVQQLTARSVQDYRLNFKIRTKCAKDVDAMCSAEKAAVDGMTMAELFGTKEADAEAKSGQVLHCLKEHLNGIKSPPCKEEVGQVIRIQAVDAKADPILKRVCKADIEEHCSSAPPAKVHLCLRKNMEKLSAGCQKAEALQGKLEAGEVLMKPQMVKACQGAFSQFCSDVAVGSAQTIRCLQDHMGDPGFPSGCKDMVMEDMEASSKDWRLKYGISHMCYPDAAKLCDDVLEEGAGKVLGCLKQAYLDKEIKGDGCKKEVLRFVSQGVNDIRMAPNNYHACVGDVEQFCEDIEPGSGRVHACLLEHKTEISSECATEEFKTQAIRTRNIRADTEALRVCKTAMAKFCPDQSPGEGRVWQCLGKHLSDHDMSNPCKDAVRKVQILVHSEFNLDPGMSKHCRADAERMCDGYLYVADYKDFSGLGDVTSCLINNVGNVSSSDCRADVRRKASERLKSAELDPVRTDMCVYDIDEFCKDESKAGGEGKVHACLSNHFRELSTNCQDIQKTYMVVASSDARVNVPVQRSCQGAQKKFCASAKGAGGIMSCLLAHMHDEGMNTACKEVLLAESKKRAMDYDFNVKLKKACDPVLQTRAANNLVDKCDRSRENWQTVCLTNNIASITGPGSAACRSEARSVLKLHSADLRARPGMEGACQQDIERLCDDTEAGAGRWHQCLRKKLNEISDAQCKKMVTKFGTVAGTHATIDYAIRTKCANEMKTFCKDIPAGDSRVMVCLRVKAKEEAEGFSQACRAALDVSATFALPGNNISSRMANFTMMKTDGLDEIKKFIYEHESFTDKWGAGLFVGTACFVAVLAFACSYYILQRKFNKVMYTVAMPDSAC